MALELGAFWLLDMIWLWVSPNVDNIVAIKASKFIKFLDEPVDVREESGRIVIEPVQRKEYDLAELVKGITRENLHREIDFGGPAGKEAW